MEYISLGSNCSITYQLEKLDLRKNAYPFDWVKITLNQLLNILIENFNDFIESLEFVKISPYHLIQESLVNDELKISSLILTNKYNIKFAHELSEKYQIDIFKIKMLKRIERFRELGNKNITFVRIELSPIDKSWYKNICYLIEILNKYSTNFKLILIVCSDLEFTFPSNILIYKFNKFTPDWKMDMLDWNKIFF